MADSIIGSIAVQIKAKNENLLNGLKESNTAIVDFKNKFSKDFGAIAAVGAASFAAVAFAITKCIGAAAEAEQVDNDLAIALRNAGVEGGEAAKRLSEYATALEMQTGVGDEAIKRGMTELIQFGLTGNALKAATQASLDLAAAKKIDLTQAAEQVGKAFMGETGRLKMLGISIDESVPKADRFKMALTQMNEKFGGAAQGQLDTMTGKMNLLKEQFGDAQESIGMLFIPVLNKFLPLVNRSAQIVLEFANAVQQKIEKFGFARTALNMYVTAVGAFLEAIRMAINAIPGMDTVLRTMGSSLQGVNATLDTAQAKLTMMSSAVTNNANVTKAADTAVAANKVTAEQARAAQTLLIQQAEINEKLKLKEAEEKELQAIKIESEAFTASAQKAAAQREDDMRRAKEKAETEHRRFLTNVADQSEKAMTTIFSRELDAREKKQKIFRQSLDLLQKQITDTFIASQSKQSAAAVRSSAIETGAAKAPIAANFFKAFSPIPFVGQALAVAAIAAAFSFIDRLVKFNKGGEVGGSGNKDTVPALLTPGERVLTRDENKALKRGGFGGGGGVNLTVNIQGTLIEGNEAHWRQMFKNKIMPEIRRQTMVAPTGPHTRRRGSSR